ncbi:NAD-binding protein [Phellopilus nigrolimitatus]|nr:NAD-binding protein [Phellopilus nigrolimitatus]
MGKHEFDAAKDLGDLNGKVVIVTGSTSGLGFVTAQTLVRKGAKVYLAARNEAKAADCIKRIKEAGTGGGTVLYHHLDLADPREAKKSAEAFLKKEERLDLLVNNAAMVTDDFKIAFGGIQQVMVVNYISPFVFTDVLLPLLKKTDTQPGSDVRIVNEARLAKLKDPSLHYRIILLFQLTSAAHTFVPDGLRFRSKEDYNLSWGEQFAGSFKRYGLSKLADILWSRELQRRLTAEGSNIIVLNVHPGAVLTEGNEITTRRIVRPLRPLYTLLCRLAFESPQTGVATSAIAAASPKVRAEAEKYRNAYLVPHGKIGKCAKQAQDDALAGELWETTAGFLKEWGILDGSSS